MSTLAIKNLRKSNSANQTEITLALEGNLDNTTVGILERNLSNALETKPAQLILDLAGLKFVTSAGIRLFLLAGKKQKSHQGRVSFVNLQPQIKEVFAIMGSMPDMKVFSSQAELDAYLLARQRTYAP